MLGYVKKYHSVLGDSITNIIAFTMLVGSQQLVAFPIIAKNISANDFGVILIIMGIVNVFSVLTSNLPCVHLVSPLDDKKNSYNYLFLAVFVFIFFVSLILVFLIFDKLEWLTKFYFVILCLSTCFRAFITTNYQIENHFRNVVIQNVFYVLGLGIGVCVCSFCFNWLLLFIIADFFSFLYSWNEIKKLCRQYCSMRFSIKGITNYVNFITKDIISYLLNLFDRFIIYPVLGGTYVSVYYSMNSVSKLFSLVLNPLGVVLFMKMSVTDDRKMMILNVISIVSVLFMGLTFLLFLMIIPLYVKIFYPAYIASIEGIYVYVALSGGISCSLVMFKSLILKLCPLHKLRNIYIQYMILFLALSLLFVYKYGLLGFVIINIVLNVFLFLLLFVVVKRVIKNEEFQLINHKE